MNVVVVAGICIENDAISAAAVGQAELLCELDDVADVAIAAQLHDRTTTIPCYTARDPWELLRLPVVREADIMIFHWGIHYSAFDALPVVAQDRAVVVHFHNLTPPHLVDAEFRGAIDRSRAQMELPALTGSELWSESEYNLQTLRDWGYPDGQLRFMPFPIEPLGRPAARRARDHDTVRLLTVGRLVKAKGLDVLVEAMAQVVAEFDGSVSLTIAGSSDLSDHQFVDGLMSSIEASGLEATVSIERDLDDEALWQEYLLADVVVSPSLHEGLCVPVIEGYLAGCRVIGTDAGNLPHVVQPPDPIVPAGDPNSLADAIMTMCDAVVAGNNASPAGAADLIATYSPANASERLRSALREISNDAGRAST